MEILKSSFQGTWKNTRWKIKFRLFSTINRTSEALNSIVSTNISIASNAKVGKLDYARNLFDAMPERTVVSWNAMISGYSNWARYNEALSLVSLMHCNNIRLNEVTFSTALSSCAHSESLCEGKQLHCLVLKTGLEIFNLVGTALLYLYSRGFQIRNAKLVFDELHNQNELLWSSMLVGYVQCNLMNESFDLFMKMPKRDVVAWTTLISGYAKTEQGCEKALELFYWMRKTSEALPNEFTFDCVIRVCGKLGFFNEGKVVHGQLSKFGFELDHSIGGALIKFYCTCDAINDAKRICDTIPSLNVNALNSLIEGFLLMGRIEDAEEIFNRQREKNLVSCNMMIKGYAMSGRVKESNRLFETMTHKNLVSSNTMISVYSRNCEIDKALKLFEETKGERHAVTWNSMISGYIQNHQHLEALKLYMKMCRLSIECSRSTFSVILHACTYLGSLQLGQSLHTHVVKTSFESNVYVGTSLIDMYSKCGSIIDAQKSFMSISSPNVAAFTALINGFVHHGLGTKALSLFKTMLKQRIEPNSATLLGILSACFRADLVNEGMELFHSMEKCYGVIPTLEHYACVVDLLGRSGHLEEAEKFIGKMPINPDGVIWGSLLNACWFWSNMEIGERVAEKMFEVGPEFTSAYVILSNMYAVSGKWMEKNNVRNKLRDFAVKKDPGCSWIEICNRNHVFSVEDRTHPNCNMIYATLEKLMKSISSVV